MFLLLEAWTLDEWIDGWAEFALVEIGAEFASLILARMGHAEAHHRVDSSFTRGEYWSYVPQWLEFSDEMEELLGEREVVVLHEGPKVVKADVIQQDCTRMCIEIAGSGSAEVRWCSYIKHTNVLMETAAVPRQVFEGIDNELH